MILTEQFIDFYILSNMLAYLHSGNTHSISSQLPSFKNRQYYQGFDMGVGGIDP